MFSKILIANRGEIAVRIARTAKAMGVQTVAVCSEVDVKALHTHVCDQSVMIGGASPTESYLNGQRIVEAALTTGAQAIHPGYGFLSENAEFAELCEAKGIKFIGPSSSVIRAMGLKSSAKTIAEKAGVKLLSGFHGEDQSDEVLATEASRIGFPLLIKASAGGGGKGMRIVDRLDDFMTALAAARREAENSFNNDHVLLERYIKAPRHIEVQIFADQQGNYVHLFERDCSLQRRYQKVIEEAPAPAIEAEIRRSLGETAIAVAKAVGYEGAGTVEFIMDENQHFYFIEMNTRLQVEHPVTEMITGQDLVEWQLRVASGEMLPKKQKDIKLKGHAIEARVYAENPARNFLPVSGRIQYLKERRGADSDVRIDSGVQVGDDVGIYYDPMIAKIICWAETRKAALNKLQVALSDYQLAGIQTNTNFLRALLSFSNFSEAEQHPENLNTGLIDRYMESLHQQQELTLVSTVALFLAYELRGMLGGQLGSGLSSDPYSPWRYVDGWRLNRDASRIFRFICGDQTHEVVLSLGLNQMQFIFNGVEYELNDVHYDSDQIQLNVSGSLYEGVVFEGVSGVTIFCDGQTTAISRPQFDLDLEEESGSLLIAPLPGRVRQILVKVGDSVNKDQALVILEAMKMEHTILSSMSGIVVEIFYSEGDQVLEGVELLALRGG
ncbi:MAG: biotin/lipoyl-binding protein [Proteobacteria bacterium]|nr:biotin/lipoyl-binding protein [Pseudomonadota bacterium]MDA1331439.1 biotin/lipoyl-binding protein [Pseudomonadota bacterium]